MWSLLNETADEVVRDPGTQGILLLIIGSFITVGGSLFLVLFRETVKALQTLNRTMVHIDKRLVAVEVKMGIPMVLPEEEEDNA